MSEKVVATNKTLKTLGENPDLIKPLGNYCCNKCGKYFDTQQGLNGHQLSHSIEKAPWVCFHCGVDLVENNWYPCHRNRRRICSECQREKNKEQNTRNKERVNAHNRENNRIKKLKVIVEYGGKCECCGEVNPEFLTIDHIEGGGNQHRKLLGDQGKGIHFYTWLIRAEFPKEPFRLLCMNCNFSYGKYGYCPHKVEYTEFDVVKEKVLSEQ